MTGFRRDPSVRGDLEETLGLSREHLTLPGVPEGGLPGVSVPDGPVERGDGAAGGVGDAGGAVSLRRG